MVNEFYEKRKYVLRALSEQGSDCPKNYATMLATTPSNRVIENLDPWAFLPDPERSSEYCSRAIGSAVLPFAQAIGEDLVACFVAYPLRAPKVVVINPWSDDKKTVLKSVLGDYDAWLPYAAEVSRQVQRKEADENSDND